MQGGNLGNVNLKKYKKIYCQKQIRRGSLGNKPPKDFLKIYLYIDKNFSITYQTKSNIRCTPSIEPESTYETDALDFAIWAKFMRIEIYLHGAPKGVKWRWSRKLDAFTTKDKKRTKHYGHLHYKSEEISSEWTKADDWIQLDGLYAESKVIMFEAKQKKVRKKESHPYSLNIEIQQSDGKWLPITIDPDVRNPPTRPGKELEDCINNKIKEGESKNPKEKIFLFDSSIET